MRKVGVAVCSLNQWALSFDSNTRNIQEAIRIAAEQGADVLVCPELAITGYGCEDHFLENDILLHSWECLAHILKSGTTGLVCDIGMPVMYNGVRYNCRVFCRDQEILLIRPKKYMANDYNYREMRWFSSWKREAELAVFQLPEEIESISSQSEVPFGDGFIAFKDTSLGAECCEELFTPLQSTLALSLSGVEIIANGSASHHEPGKLRKRLDHIRNATERSGGAYLYSNQQGCDGGRLYYDGGACIVMNGQILVQGDEFSLRDVGVWTAHIDLDEITSHRARSSSYMEQASTPRQALPCVKQRYRLSKQNSRSPLCTKLLSTEKGCDRSLEEEIALGPACWLWDYLRRSGACGFLLPLSGGADSSAVAAIVGSMCQLVLKEIGKGDKQVLKDAQRIGSYKDGERPETHQEFAARIFETVYLRSENSSAETSSRAAILARQVGCRHWNLRIDEIVKALVFSFATMTGRRLRYKVDGGSVSENLALQNVQARVRMVVSYMLASLLPWVRGKNGFYLVLGSANADESLRGYFTKYDCSSADINPIGSMSKNDLRCFLRWAADNLGYPVLADVEVAPPTAELEPSRGGHKQLDEVDMGMTYDELQKFGELRKVDNMGPVSMFQRLKDIWTSLRADEVAAKVKMFFKSYASNRHKMTTLTPSYHAQRYSPDDNRFDLRPFLYNAAWTWQFKKIDELVDSEA